MTPDDFQLSRETSRLIHQFQYERNNFGHTAISLEEIPPDFPTGILDVELSIDQQRLFIQDMRIELGEKEGIIYYASLHDTLRTITLLAYCPAEDCEILPTRLLLTSEVRTSLSHPAKVVTEQTVPKAQRTVQAPHPDGQGRSPSL